VGTPVVREVPGEHLLPVVEGARPHRVWVIPAVPQSAGPELFRLPAEVLFLRLAHPVGSVPEELGVPLGEAELPGHPGAAPLAPTLVPTAVHRPVPGERHAILTREDRLDALRRPVLEPIGNLLDRDEVQVAVDRVHRAQVARRVMVDDPARVQGAHDGLGPQGEVRVVSAPLIVTRVLGAVDQVRVHVLVVARSVVAHAVRHHRRVVLGRADVEFRVARVAVGPVGVHGLPVVMAEVRLRQRHEHAHVVRGPQHFRETDMRAGLAAIVVGVDEVDAEALEALQGFPSALVGRGPGPIWALSRGTAER
jgi:hypothetical protein